MGCTRFHVTLFIYMCVCMCVKISLIFTRFLLLNLCIGDYIAIYNFSQVYFGNVVVHQYFKEHMQRSNLFLENLTE